MQESERDLNIVLVGIDYSFLSKVGKLLADQLDMYYLNSQELYEFDIQPYTMSFILRRFKEDYFREKQKDTMKYVASFSNTVITVESGALMYQENIDRLTKDGLIVYIQEDVNSLKKKLDRHDYLSKEEFNFYALLKRDIITRDEVLRGVSEIVVESTGANEIKCVSEIIKNIKAYYGVE